MFKKLLILASVLFISQGLFAKVNVKSDFDSLGGNKKIMKRARALKGKRKVRVVQKRKVNRNLKLEIAGHFGGVFGGSAYVDSSYYGPQLEFHINPRWSVGARYYMFSNSFSTEGKAFLDRAKTSISTAVPNIDSPTDLMLGTISWYPIYGKLSLLNLGVAQFDTYLIAGAGQMNLERPTAPQKTKSTVMTAGAGVGIWVSKHISVRAEMRWQNYNDRFEGKERNINATVGNLSLGYIF